MKANSVTSYSVGLFWFSPDYEEIVEIKGQVSVNPADLTRSKRIDPVGLHAEYDMPRNLPRGRICYSDKTFTIWVGEDCVIDPTQKVRDAFGLSKLDDSLFKVKRHNHWNTKS